MCSPGSGINDATVQLCDSFRWPYSLSSEVAILALDCKTLGTAGVVTSPAVAGLMHISELNGYEFDDR